jgi:hypothetical protein
MGFFQPLVNGGLAPASTALTDADLSWEYNAQSESRRRAKVKDGLRQEGEWKSGKQSPIVGARRVVGSDAHHQKCRRKWNMTILLICRDLAAKKMGQIMMIRIMRSNEISDIPNISPSSTGS